MGDDRVGALTIVTDHLIQSGARMLYEMAPLSMVSSRLAGDMRDRTTKVRLQYRRCLPCLTVHMCRACLRVSRRVHHFGFCLECKPSHAPEMCRSVMRKIFRLPGVLIDSMPWRYYHKNKKKLTRLQYVRDKVMALSDGHSQSICKRKRAKRWLELLSNETLCRSVCD